MKLKPSSTNWLWKVVRTLRRF